MLDELNPGRPGFLPPPGFDRAFRPGGPYVLPPPLRSFQEGRLPPPGSQPGLPPPMEFPDGVPAAEDLARRLANPQLYGGQPGQTPPMAIVAPGGAGGSLGTVYTPGQPPQRIPSVDELLRGGQPVMLDNRQGSGGYMSGGRGGSERPNPIFEGPVPTPPGPPNQGLPTELLPGIPLPDIYIEDPVQSEQYFRRLMDRRSQDLLAYQAEQEAQMRQRLDRLTPEQRAQIGQPPVLDPRTGLPPGVVAGPGPVIRDLPGGEISPEVRRRFAEIFPGVDPDRVASGGPVKMPSPYDPVYNQPGQTPPPIQGLPPGMGIWSNLVDFDQGLAFHRMAMAGQPGQTPQTAPTIFPTVGYNPIDQGFAGASSPQPMQGPQVQPPQFTAQAAPNPTADLMSQYLGIAQNIAGTMNR